MEELFTNPILTNLITFITLILIYCLLLFIATAVLIDLIKQNKDDDKYQGNIDDCDVNKQEEYNPFNSWNDPFDS